MGPRKQSAKSRVGEYLTGRGPGAVTEEEFEHLGELLAPISHGYLRRLLRQSGAPLTPLVEGVRQESLEDLKRTLLALETEYRRAREGGDAARERLCRRLVIEAKDHARWALRRGKGSPEETALRREAVQWMLVWLENPAVFPLWAGLRARRLERDSRTLNPALPAADISF
jgi:hypothetical protein